MAWLLLLLDVPLKGLNATALKGLQAFGASHPIGGENPISFCNVFWVAQLIVGLSVLLPGRDQLPFLLARLEGADRRLLVLDTVLGLVLGPVAFYFALALILFGPSHFHLLHAAWVVGVIVIYGIGLSLGSELALRQAYRHWSVAQVSLGGSLTIVVAVIRAALVLGEALHPITVMGLLLVLLGTRMSTAFGGA